MKSKQVVLSLVVMLAFGIPSVGAQDDSGYTIELGSGWERFEYKDGATIRRVEYIYGDRSDALLKVKRGRHAPAESLQQMVESESNRSLRFQPGYVQGRTEPFGGGAHRGVLVEYDYTRAGRPMLGRHYYLEGKGGTYWVLQFTGDRTILGRIRNVTDQMARSFREE